jgi:large subunit ribosomal protein L21
LAPEFAEVRFVYAVVETGGKQYRVEAGQTVRFEKLPGAAGDAVVLDRVLLIGGDQTVVGAPLVTGARVVGTVVGQNLAKKVVVFKYKSKARYRRKTGHRQPFTAVRIDSIEVS